ncbi:MAG: methyltransferase domain-containing protein [Gammaproteobacteria bacterium]
MAKYRDEFFRDRHARTVYAAETVLGILLPALPPVSSAIDVGCGVGTWLSVLARHDVTGIQGVDGPWVDVANLAIPRENFTHHDLREDRNFGRRFDLAISLEVAEHLPPDRATGFVGWLTGLSDIVLFSAATPQQGGKNHYNEQWQDYWAALFAARDYVPADFIRAKIWNDAKIATWYRQNLLVYVRRNRLPELRLQHGAGVPGPLSIVHPEVFLAKLDRAATVGGVLKRWRRALRRSLKA